MGGANGLVKRLKTAVLAVAAAAGLAGSLAHAQIIGEPVRFKSEFRVNTTTEGGHVHTGVFALTTGDYVVAWRSSESSGWVYFIQRFRADSTRIGGPVPVPGSPMIAPLDDGGYVLAWSAVGSSGDNDIFTRRYSATHTRIGPDRQANTVSAGNQSLIGLTALKGSGYVVGWTSAIQEGSFARQFSVDNLPVAGEQKIHTFVGGAQGASVIAAQEDGGFVAVWVSVGQDGSDKGVYTQRFRADGRRFGGERRVNTFTDGAQARPGVVALKDGGYVIVWNSVGQDGSGDGIYGQRYRADNSRFGGEFRINSYTMGDQFRWDLIALPDSGYLVVWSTAGQDSPARNIYAQRYDAANAPVGVERRVNTSTVGDKHIPLAFAAPDGGYWITWASNGQVATGISALHAQRFATNDAPVGDEVQINERNSRSVGYNDVVVLADGSLFIAWVSFGQDWVDVFENSMGVYGRRLSADGHAVGREFPINTFVVGDQQAAKLARLVDGKVVAVWFSARGSSGIERFGVYAQVFRVTGAPVAMADKASTTSGVPITIPVLVNDIDPDIGDSLTVISATATNGGAVINADGTITYTPSGPCVETDTITYTIRDLAGLTSTSNVDVRIARGPRMSIYPAGGFVFTGPPGGPFSEPNKGALSISNFGCTDLEWEVLLSVPWLSVQGSPIGMLVPGDQTFAVMEPNAAAMALPRGIYRGWVTIRNRTNGVGNERRPVYLSVQ